MIAGRIAFGLLVAGELIQWVAILAGGAVYPGYDPLRQYISELGATGAVTGWAVSWLGFVPSGVFIAAGCLIAALLVRRSGLAVAGCLMLAWYGMSLSGAGLYPCAFECVRTDASFNQLMHDLVGGTGYLLAPPGVLLVALWARRGRDPWLFPLGIVCGIVAGFGFVGLIVDPELGGLVQRALEVAVTVFLLAFGWSLARVRPAMVVA